MSNTKKKTAILILNHFMSADLLRLHAQINASCEKQYDVFLLSDRTRRGIPWPLKTRKTRQHVFTRTDLESMAYPGKQNLLVEQVGKRNMKLGNAELPVMLFKAAYPEYEQYWVVEYDVRFSGDWSCLFSRFSENNADLLGTTLCVFPECPDWNHWSSVKIPTFDLRKNQLVRGFFPVYRISRKAIECMDKAYSEGCAGHMEALMPSLLHHSGFKLEDLGGSGKFVAHGNENRFYTNNPLDNTLAPGSFVYRPWITTPGTRPNTLWHPVKAPLNPIVSSLKNGLKRLVR